MRKGYIIGRILLTVLLSFCVAGYVISSSADAMLSLPGIYKDIIKSEKLADKAYAAIENDFKKQYNTTAIPPEVYMDSIDTQWIETEMCIRTKMHIESINGNYYDRLYDYAEIEDSVTEFFHEYAESIDYTPDDAFDKKLNETIANARDVIDNNLDAFYMDVINDNGYLDKVREYMPIIRIINWCTFAVSIILLFALALLEKSKGIKKLYWSGTGLFCGGMLTAIPMLYILCTDGISRFAIKDAVIFSAVTRLLDSGLWRIMTKSLVFAALGAAIIILTVVMNKSRYTENQTIVQDKK